MGPFTRLAALLFLVAATAHAYRLFENHFAIVVAGHEIPLWASWIGLGAGLVLGLMLFAESRKRDLRM